MLLSDRRMEFVVPLGVEAFKINSIAIIEIGRIFFFLKISALNTINIKYSTKL